MAAAGGHGQALLYYPASPYIALHCLALPRLAYPSAVDDGKQYEKNVLGWDGGRGLEARLLLLLLLLVLLPVPFPRAPPFCDHHLSDQTALNTTATYVRRCSINPALVDNAHLPKPHDMHILSLLAGCLPAVHDASPGRKGAGDQSGLGWDGTRGRPATRIVEQNTLTLWYDRECPSSLAAGGLGLGPGHRPWTLFCVMPCHSIRCD